VTFWWSNTDWYKNRRMNSWRQENNNIFSLHEYTELTNWKIAYFWPPIVFVLYVCHPWSENVATFTKLNNTQKKTFKIICKRIGRLQGDWTNDTLIATIWTSWDEFKLFSSKRWTVWKTF
jgi:hypothetical protein